MREAPQLSELHPGVSPQIAIKCLSAMQFRCPGLGDRPGFLPHHVSVPRLAGFPCDDVIGTRPWRDADARWRLAGHMQRVGQWRQQCAWERPPRAHRPPRRFSLIKSNIMKRIFHEKNTKKRSRLPQNGALYPHSCPPASAASWLGRSTRRKRLRTALGERPGSSAAIAAHFCPRRSTWLVRT